MTEETRHSDTLRDVSHTHPDTDQSFGANFTFARGGAVAADGGRDPRSRARQSAPPSDGGRPDVVPEENGAVVEAGTDGTPGRETLGDVAHVPPDGHGANPVFERGGEGRDDPVASDDD